MRRHIFTPIAEEKRYRYVATTAEWDRMHHPISRGFKFFETMGDGSTAHTPDHPLQMLQLGDYLMSLAEALLDNKELFEVVSYELRTPCTDEAMAFAHGIKYNEEKRRYFDPRALKVTTNESKRHDKRFFEVTNVMDGNPMGMFHVLCLEGYSGMQKFALMHAVLDWFRRTDNVIFGKSCAEQLSWDVTTEYGHLLDAAYRAVHGLIEAHEQQSMAIRSIVNYRRTLKETQEVVSVPQGDSE